MAHICHLTILNPTTHTRIFYKLALSQVEMGHQVSIIGLDQSTASYQKEGVEIIPIKPFHRLSWRRLWVQFRILKIALKLKADAYTIHTPELLFLGLILKWRTNAKLIYDVHEDYQANIRAATYYPNWLKGFLSTVIRFWEKRAIKHFSAVVYAEECYDNVLKIPIEKKYFLRNKFTEKSITGKAKVILPEQSYMLYTGTFAEEWGVLKTIDLWKRLNQNRPQFLIMAGFTHNSSLLEKIKKEVEASELEDMFMLIGGNTYVPYADIVHLIANCEFGTALYQVSPNIKGKIPTKFYEYMAFNKPLIYTDDETWNQFNEKFQIGLSFTENTFNKEFVEKLESLKRNLVQHQEDNYSWKSEEKELEKMMFFLKLS